MTQQKSKKKALAKKLLHKYRLVILNEDTFEERVSFKLTRLNVFILVGISAIILITLTSLLIALTPLREYIPGYSSEKLKRESQILVQKADSLQKETEKNNKLYLKIRDVLAGTLEPGSLDTDSLRNSAVNIDTLNLNASQETLELQNFVEKEDKYNIFESAEESANFALFPPVKGSISSRYNPSTKHYALDIVTDKDAPVKAAGDGTVIFAEWTSETGQVIIIEHANDMITVYKHNASLNKKQGDLVKAGEVIATVGNTGALTTGPHLHFELWSKGYAIDPTNFIDFN